MVNPTGKRCRSPDALAGTGFRSRPPPLRQLGIGASEIARTLGCGRASVYRLVKALGRRDEVEASGMLDALVASAARHSRRSIVLSSPSSTVRFTKALSIHSNPLGGGGLALHFPRTGSVGLAHGGWIDAAGSAIVVGP